MGYGWCQYGVKVTNTNKDILKEIQAVYCGNIVVAKHADGKSKTVYRLEITNRKDIICILNAILPFLRVRKRQAEILLQYLTRQPSAKTSEIERDLCRQMAEVNRRGPSCLA